MITPRGERLHIGIFGKRNAGKSSFINSITGQYSSIVSEEKGTTTDPVYKAMEIHGLGPVVFIDTAGIDDEGDLGQQRIDKTNSVVMKCDLLVYLLSDIDEYKYINMMKKTNKPMIYLISKADLPESGKLIEAYSELNPLIFKKEDTKSKNDILKFLSEKFQYNKERTITGELVTSNDSVLLVTPQDIQAPKGRLILPQVQTIRELLDKKAMIHICTLDNMKSMLGSLRTSPKLIITDSQYFKEVYELKPEESKITSFSVLFSQYKGDVDYFIQSVKALENIDLINNILIAEACTHPPLEEDIGRVKIPKLLEKKYNKKFDFSFVRGDDFSDIENFDLIIHCGSCMFNQAHTQSRVDNAKKLNIPMTNYGIIIAYLHAILDDIDYN